MAVWLRNGVCSGCFHGTFYNILGRMEDNFVCPLYTSCSLPVCPKNVNRSMYSLYGDLTHDIEVWVSFTLINKEHVVNCVVLTHFD